MSVLAALALASLQAPDPAVAGPGAPVHLRCESLVEPLGLDVPSPRLSWMLQDPRPGAEQSAWQVVVAAQEGGPVPDRATLWDSGKVASSETVGIAYAGPPLASRTRYAWRVRVWDGEGRASPWSSTASWTTGLLSPEEWEARWIGDPDPAPGPSPARWGFHSSPAASAGETAWAQVELPAPSDLDGLRLHPAHAPGGPSLFPLRFRVWAGAGPEFPRDFEKVFDRSDSDVADPGYQPLTIALDPLLRGQRCVRLEVVGPREIPGLGRAFALAELELTLRGQCVSIGARATSSGSREGQGWSLDQLADGELQSRGELPPPALPAPILRQEFELDPGVRRAVLRATALGLLEVRLNGESVAERVLAPSWTDFRERALVLTSDVTARLGRRNAIAVLLGDGRYAGQLGSPPFRPEFPRRGAYERRPRLLLQLEVDFEDGSRRTIATDGTWRSTLDGPVRRSDPFEGETVDARNELPGFDRPGFDDSAWKPAEVDATVHARPVGDRAQPARALAEIPAAARLAPWSGTWIYDFGEILFGRCRIVARESPAGLIVLRHAEMLEEQPNETRIHVSNLRSAEHIDRFVLKGGATEVLEPRFAARSFRYVEVTGFPQPPEAEDVGALVIASDLAPAGSFECSEPAWNRLWENAGRTIRNALAGMPNLGSARDEQLPWCGEVRTIAQSAAFQADVSALLAQWLVEVRGAQRADGAFPDLAPNPFGDARFHGTPGWADAGVLVPWTLWVNYADRRVLEESFAPAARWIEHVRARNPELVWRNARGQDLGDRLDGDSLRIEGWPRSGAGVPKDVFATAHFARSAEIASRMARALGREADARTLSGLAASIREAFRRAFVSDDGRIAGDSQGAYALALDCELLPVELRGAALGHLVRTIEAYPGGALGGRALSTGADTTHRALLALSRGGRHDLALELMRRTDPGSLGFQVAHGATTMWERRDAWDGALGFADPAANVFDHPAFAAVGEWLMRAVAGIEPDEEGPGWKRFTVHLRDQPGLDHARGELLTVRGRIACAWRRLEDRFEVEVVVPPNTSAIVVVHVPKPGQVRAATGMRPLSTGGGECRFEAPAGTHRFVFTSPR